MAGGTLGSRLALIAFRAVGLAALGLASGCLVTDPIEFERPRNNPPAFVAEQPARLQVGEIKYVDNRQAASWPFTLRIRDVDVTQDLEARWRIVTVGDDMPMRAPTIFLPATGEVTRDFDIIIESTRLRTDNCHRVEIAVSGSFDKPFEGDPEDLTEFTDRSDREDLALFSFWIWEGERASNDPAKIVDTCVTRTYEPPVVSGGGAGETAP